jgi:putative thioredoxin
VSDFLSRANLSGAVDLSGLRKPDPVAQAAKPSDSADVPAIKVPDLVALGTEANIKNFVTISQAVPVLIDFFALDLEQSLQLSSKLEGAVRALQGKMFLLRVNTETALTVAQAFGVKEVPSVIAMIKGQPIPLFEGDQTAETITTVLDRLLQVAAENGVAATLDVSEEFSSSEIPELAGKHKEAFAAIDSGDYPAAVAAYEAALKENPADAVAVAGLAQSKLLVRTKDLDFESVLSSAPSDYESTIKKADACVAVGHMGEGFQTILTRFSNADKDEREKLRKHLLELFLVAPPELPELAQARKALAALLY